MLDRREFSVGLAALGVGLSTRKSFATVSLGEGTLTTVSDGQLTLPAEFIFEPMPQEELVPLRAKFGLHGDQLTPECNLALFSEGTRNVLFDVGSGPDFMPTAGLVEDSLDAVGLTPGDITDVIFTHAHPDHIWGLLDDFGDPLFYNANYYMGQTEWDYWWNPSTVDTIGAARQVFAVGAKRRMEIIADSVAFFDDGDEVLPGISAIASFGHTPGHMSFEVRRGSDAALVVGDAIGNHHVAFARPEWSSGSDQDPDTAIISRKMLLDRLVAEQLSVVGFHLPGGGIGRVERTADGYQFVGDTQ